MAIRDRLGTLIHPLRLIWASIRMHYDTLKEALRKDGLVALTRLGKLRAIAAASLLIRNSNGFIAYEDTTCVPSLLKSAQGKILELGPGPGNQLHRFDKSRVEFIYAVEPSPHFADEITARAHKHGLQDRYKLLTCGIEDSDILRSEGITEGSLDTVLSIQVLCAVGNVESVMKEVWKLLKPGGRFIFWEHGRSKDPLTAMTQVCWNPTWGSLVGCQINRDIKTAILEAGEWENPGDVEEPEDPYSCLPRAWGVLIKKA